MRIFATVHHLFENRLVTSCGGGDGVGESGMLRMNLEILRNRQVWTGLLFFQLPLQKIDLIDRFALRELAEMVFQGGPIGRQSFGGFFGIADPLWEFGQSSDSPRPGV